MKTVTNNLKEFISEQKGYFELTSGSSVEFDWYGIGYKNKKLNGRWVGESKYSNGLFSCDRRVIINFSSIYVSRMKGVYFDNENHILPKVLNINNEFQDFIKSLIIRQYRLHKTSLKSMMKSIGLLMKSIYVRMVINGQKSPRVMNINSTIIKQAMDAQALEAKNSALNQDSMVYLIDTINRLGVTLTPLYFTPTVSRSTNKKNRYIDKNHTSEKFHKCDFTDELDEDEDRKLITIQAFLNIVSARSLVKTDGEKIMLNLVLLLMVTGFRFGEARALRINSLKRLDIEDSDVVETLQMKGLMTYYLGIEYAGEKGASQRVHWVEPLAIPLVETIYSDTIKLTENLRRIYTNFRRTNIKNLLPENLKNQEKIELDDIIEHIAVLNPNRSSRRANSRNQMLNRLKEKELLPCSQGSNNTRYYSSDINDFLLRMAYYAPEVNDENFSFNFTDSATNQVINIPYENLLFIAPLGSLTTGNKLHYPTIATPIVPSCIFSFLGSNMSMKSLFEKYGLVEEDGEFTRLTTHMPRHNINTFLAIADVNEHLQAAIMGRVDITQNTKYQHLALEERAKSSSIVPYDQTNRELSYKHTNANPINTVIETGIISLNPNLQTHNSINQSFHTFTTFEDTVDFFEEMINSDIEDITAGLRVSYELKSSRSEQKTLLNSHATLHPLDLGSCMRKIELWSCPYNHKCQDGKPCPYFTLTGRSDEQAKLELKIQINMRNVKELQTLASQGVITSLEFAELSDNFNLIAQHLERLSRLSTSLEFPKQPINLVAFDDQKRPKTLATIFAYEHRKLEKQNSKREDNND